MKRPDTILFVDDEPALRRLRKTILEHHGYIVVEASNGSEALEMYSRKKDSIALVVLDLTMPGLSGEEVLKELRKKNPSAKVVISSGNLAEEKEAELLVPGAVQFVPKPYPTEDLARCVRELLETPGSR